MHDLVPVDQDAGLLVGSSVMSDSCLVLGIISGQCAQSLTGTTTWLVLPSCTTGWHQPRCGFKAMQHPQLCGDHVDLPPPFPSNLRIKHALPRVAPCLPASFAPLPPGSPGYDPSTLHIPPAALAAMSDFGRQFWVRPAGTCSTQGDAQEDQQHPFPLSLTCISSNSEH